MGSGGASTSGASEKARINVVSQCRERKRLLKKALVCRRAFSHAYCNYILSLHNVGETINSFVAGLSAPPSRYLISNINLSTSESNDTTDNNLNPTPNPPKTPPEPQNKTLSSQPSNPTAPSSISSSKRNKKKKGKKEQGQAQEVKAGEEDKKQDNVVAEEGRLEGEGGQKQEDDDVVCEYFHDGLTETPPMPSLQAESQAGWDFFSPYERSKAQTEDVCVEDFDENLVRMMREEEGIPGLEEVGMVMKELHIQYACVTDRKKGVCEVTIEENSDEIVEESKHMKVTDTHKNKGGVSCAKAGNTANEIVAHEGHPVTVMDDDDAPTSGRELLEVLKDIEDCFVKAYESGLEVSRMLEAKRVHLQTHLVGRKGSSSKSKIFRSIMKGPISSRASCFSIFSSGPRSSSTWIEFNSDLCYDEMEMGSHSETLCRLYEWERKLYDDVKSSEDSKTLYDRKCIKLRRKNVKVDAFYSGKTRADVTALHACNSVSVERAKSTSEKIVKIRDEELHPQLLELRQGLRSAWKNMLQLHEKQRRVMLEVASINCPSYGWFCNKYHRLATVVLCAALQNWRSCFSKYVSSQKAYLEVLNGWISMCIIPEIEKNSEKKDNSSSVTSKCANAIPFVAVCRHWLASLNKLPNKAVKSAIKEFGKHIRAMYAQQGKELEQKRKVDQLTKEYDRKDKAYRKAENKIYESRSNEHEWDLDAQDRLESLVGMKASLDMFKRMVDEERAKHISGMEETKNITLKGMQEGFSAVFESIIGFSKASVNMYADIVTKKEGTNEDNGHPSQEEQMDSQPFELEWRR